MAELHSSLPTHFGEAEVVRQLRSLPDNKLHLWCGIDFIPGVKDIDLIIWHEEIGVFVVEIKAIPIDHFEEFGLRKCRIKDRRESPSPQKQAMNANISLREYLAPRLKGRLPFIVSTACFSKIYRTDWDSSWSDEQITGEFSKSILFADDISSTPENLKNRLQHIWKNPPIRSGGYNFQNDPNILSSFIKLLDLSFETHKRESSLSDKEKLKILEEEVKAEVKREANFTPPIKYLFYGYPGTGKTFRLLQIALLHSSINKNVLFVCFNKTLAADIRRLVSYSEKLKSSSTQFDVKDIFELLSEHVFENSGTYFDENTIDYDGWAIEQIGKLGLHYDDLFKYDTILIDEAQDMRDWAFDLFNLFLHNKSSVYIAAGTGQELYGSTSDWLKERFNSYNKHRLNRNFRNTLQSFQLAQVFYETKLDSDKIEDVAKKFKGTSHQFENETIEFDRPKGILPKLKYLDESKLDYDGDLSVLASLQDEVMTDNFQEIIQDTVKDLELSDHFFEILILVPSEDSPEARWVRDALNNLKYDFIDYTEKRFRRNIAPNTHIRLCTFHSSRGLEGKHVIVFGVEQLETFCTKTKTDIKNLSYVVFSRSLFYNIIVLRSKANSNITKFINKAVTILQSKQGTS